MSNINFVPKDGLDAELHTKNKDYIYVPLATYETFGVVRIGEGLNIRKGLLSADPIVPPYIALNKKSDYLYEIYYSSIDYEWAKKYFETKRPEPIGGACSVVRNGDFYGRNLDWLYSEDVDFVVKVPRNAGRYASIGIASTVRDGDNALTKTEVENGKYNVLYNLVPFKIVDGINEFGVVCSTNVVPQQKNNGLLINPSGVVEQTMCQTMLPRYILDNFKTATEAVEYIAEHCAFFPNKILYEEHGYDQHFMVADKDKTYLIEFVDSEIMVTDMSPTATSYLAGKSYMTNFYLDGVALNDDGTVYTPETQTPTEKPTTTNNITTLGSGLERYNLIVDNFDTANTAAGMRALMSDLLYTRAYSSSPTPSNPYWYTEFVGEEGSSGELTVDSTTDDFSDVVAGAAILYANRSRDPESVYFGSWQTVHSCVYDIFNKKVSVVSQEQTGDVTAYDFDFAFCTESKIVLSDTLVDTWVVDSTYENYGYKATINIEGVTADDFATITFGLIDAASGNYAPICVTGVGTVTIFSKVNTTITIPNIVIMRGV